MQPTVPGLMEEHNTNSALDEKFQVLLRSQRDFLQRFGGLEEGMQVTNKADNDAPSDPFLLDRDPFVDDSDTLITNASSNDEMFGGELKASSFFDDDDHQDSLLNRPWKRARHESSSETHDAVLKEERRMISRSVLDQLSRKIPDNSTLKSSKNLPSLIPSSVHGRMKLNTVGSNMTTYTLPNTKDWMGRVSLGFLIQSLQPNTTSSTCWEPLSLFKQPYQAEITGEHFVSLESALCKSQRSQKNIQEWDKKMGLKVSHSKTMSLSSKSRKKVLALLNRR